jgi:hypothetical protein
MDDPKASKKDLAEKRLKEAIETICELEEGQYFLKYLMTVCQYQTSTLSLNPTTQEINPLALTHNEGRRRLWIHFRQFIPVGARRKIENS